MQDIEDLKNELNDKAQQIAHFTELQSEFALVGPMKNHIDQLTKMVYNKDVALANEKIDCEQYR